MCSTNESILIDPNVRIIELTTKLSSLQDLLYRHDQFREQAEHDLKLLLNTIQNQQSLIDRLNASKDQMEIEIKHFRESSANQSRSSAETPNDPKMNMDCLMRLLIQIEFVAKNHLADKNDELLNRLSTDDHSLEDRSNLALEVLDFLMKLLENLKTNLVQYQSNCSSLWTNLQQKHSESQAYHDQLQNTLKELGEAQLAKQHVENELEVLRNSSRLSVSCFIIFSIICVNLNRLM